MTARTMRRPNTRSKCKDRKWASDVAAEWESDYERRVEDHLLDTWSEWAWMWSDEIAWRAFHTADWWNHRRSGATGAVPGVATSVEEQESETKPAQLWNH